MSHVPEWAASLLPPATAPAGAQPLLWLHSWLQESPPADADTAGGGTAVCAGMVPLLLVAAERCGELSVDEHADVVESLADKAAKTRSRREELEFELTKVKLSIKRATAGAQRDDGRAVALRKKLRLLGVELGELAEIEAQQLGMQRLLTEMIRRRLEVNPEQLRQEVDSVMALGLVGSDASMGGSGSVLHVAAEQGDTAAIKAWLHKDPDCFDMVEDDGEVLDASVEAAQLHQGQHDDVEHQQANASIGHRADINGQTPNGATALYVAAYCGHAKAVELLLDEGADFSIVDVYGMGPTHAAARNGHAKIVQLLVAQGADLNSPAKHGATPLVFAVAGLQRAREQCQKIQAEVDAIAIGLEWKRKSKSINRSPKASNDDLKEFERRIAAALRGKQTQSRLKLLETKLQTLVALGGEGGRQLHEAQQVWRKQDRDYSGRLDAAELKRLVAGLREKAKGLSSEESTIVQEELVLVKQLRAMKEADGGMAWNTFWQWWWSTHRQPKLQPPQVNKKGEQVVEYKMAGTYERTLAQRERDMGSFISRSVGPMWRARQHTALTAFLEGMVRDRRKRSAELFQQAREIKDQAHEREEERRKSLWAERQRLANEETLRQRSQSLWARGEDGARLQALLKLAISARLCTDAEADESRRRVLMGLAGVSIETEKWNARLRAHRARKSETNANLISRNFQADLQEGGDESTDSDDGDSEILEDAEEGITASGAEQVNVHGMCCALPAAVLALRRQERAFMGLGSGPSGSDSRMALRKTVPTLVSELMAHPIERGVVALGALFQICHGGTIKTKHNARENARVALRAGAVPPTLRLVALHAHPTADPRTREVVGLAGPGLLAMLTVSFAAASDICCNIVTSEKGGMETLVRLLALVQSSAAQEAGITCLSNLILPSSLEGLKAREQATLAGARRVARSLCLADNPQVVRKARLLAERMGSFADELAALQLKAEEDAATKAREDEAKQNAKERAKSLLRLMNRRAEEKNGVANGPIPSPTTDEALESAERRAGAERRVLGAGYRRNAIVTSGWQRAKNLWEAEEESRELATTQLSREMPMLREEFPTLSPAEISSVCIARGGVTNIALKQLTALAATGKTKSETSRSSTLLSEGVMPELPRPQIDAERTDRATAPTRVPTADMGAVTTLAAHNISSDTVAGRRHPPPAPAKLSEHQLELTTQWHANMDVVTRLHGSTTSTGFAATVQKSASFDSCAPTEMVDLGADTDDWPDTRQALLHARERRFRDIRRKNDKKTQHAIEESRAACARTIARERSLRTKLQEGGINKWRNANAAILKLNDLLTKLENEWKYVMGKLKSAGARARKSGWIWILGEPILEGPRQGGRNGIPFARAERRFLKLYDGRLELWYGRGELLDQARALTMKHAAAVQQKQLSAVQLLPEWVVQGMSSPQKPTEDATEHDQYRQLRQHNQNLSSLRLELRPGCGAGDSDDEHMDKAAEHQDLITTEELALSRHNGTDVEATSESIHAVPEEYVDDWMAARTMSAASGGVSHLIRKFSHRLKLSTQRQAEHQQNSPNTMDQASPLASAYTLPTLSSRSPAASALFPSRNSASPKLSAVNSPSFTGSLGPPSFCGTTINASIAPPSFQHGSEGEASPASIRSGTSTQGRKFGSRTFLFQSETELRSWSEALNHGEQFQRRYVFWTDKAHALESDRAELMNKLSGWQRRLEQAQQEADVQKSAMEEELEARRREEDLREWVVNDTVSEALVEEQIVASHFVEKITNSFWGQLPMQQRVAMLRLHTSSSGESGSEAANIG